MERVDIELVDLAHGGEAVGRLEGLAVFVPLGIPGERVRVELTERRKRFARGRIVEVLDPSPQRVTPPCPHFGVCGGCQLQHMAYDAQLEAKQGVVRTLLERLGRQQAPVVRPTLPLDPPWNYRNNAQFTLDADGRLGYLALGSNRVVAVADCLILHPLLDPLWKTLRYDPAPLRRVVVRCGAYTGERLVVLEGEGRRPPRGAEATIAEVPFSLAYHAEQGRVTALRGEAVYTERLAGRDLRISPDAFFQVNTAQAERLVALAREYLALQPHETLLDAYCGVGTFALALAGEAARVVGIEEAPAAIRDARANARPGEPVEFVEGRVEDVLPRLAREGALQQLDAALLDPPRAGCAEGVLEALAARGPRRIVYVSCDPATLARDASRLSELGYTLVEAQPVDMFPQTYHVECVVLITKL